MQYIILHEQKSNKWSRIAFIRDLCRLRTVMIKYGRDII